MMQWWERFIKKHVISDDVPDGPWDLYIFPGGKVGEAPNREAVARWFALHKRRGTLGEKRAINDFTGEHIVNGEQVWLR